MNIHIADEVDGPLRVDFDGAVLKSDPFWEAVICLLRREPLSLFVLIYWFFCGKARVTREVYDRVRSEAKDLPWNATLLSTLREEQNKGRPLHLLTDLPPPLAERLASEAGLDAAHITALSETKVTAELAPLAEPRKLSLRVLLSALRIHQWLKNTLIAAPFLLTHEVSSIGGWVSVGIAFVSFSLTASAVYLLNDLIDLPSDRAHARKRHRPLPSGELSIPSALKAIVLLLAASISLALLLPVEFAVVLASYIAITTLYTTVFKRKLLVDVFVLAALYTTRIVAGTVAVSAAYSFWLLAFSLFFFLSLALVKRYSELANEELAPDVKVAGRGYFPGDMLMIGQAGISSAFAASLVLALYIESEAVDGMYTTPWLLWPICPLILYLLLRIWMIARRGEMEDDPLVFLLRDWRSQLICFSGLILVFFAAVGL
ncbi:MAG: UbiA family prenyltransferase [Pseudomonadota bacterium]